MNPIRSWRRAVLAVVLAGWAVPASADQTRVQPGPLVPTPVPSSLVIAPDVKITTVNDTTGVLAGGYVGKLVDDRVLLGAGAYWLADPRDEARLFYAGLLVGGRVFSLGRLGIDARGLVGVGEGTVYGAVAFDERPGRGVRHPPRVGGGPIRFGLKDDFFVAEPELRATVAVTDTISVNVGVGYRATSAHEALGDRLNGTTGTVGIQFRAW